VAVVELAVLLAGLADLVVVALLTDKLEVVALQILVAAVVAVAVVDIVELAVQGL